MCGINQQPPQGGHAVPDPVWVGSKWLLASLRVPVTSGTLRHQKFDVTIVVSRKSICLNFAHLQTKYHDVDTVTCAKTVFNRVSVI